MFQDAFANPIATFSSLLLIWAIGWTVGIEFSKAWKVLRKLYTKRGYEWNQKS